MSSLTDEIWKTDLDFLVPHNDRLIVQSVMNVSALTQDVLPLAAPLRVPEASTKGATDDPLHSQDTLTKIRRKNTSGKSSYVVPEGKTSYNTPKWEATGEPPGNIMHESAGRVSWRAPLPGEESPPVPTRLPEVGDWSPLSPELLNYTIALLVFAIRYLYAQLL